MNYIIEEIDIKKAFSELKLETPDQIALLPENLNEAQKLDEFIFTETLVDLRKLFRLNNVKFEVLGEDTGLYRSRKSADLYLPAIFFSLSGIFQNPNIISVALNIMSNYIYDTLKGSNGRKTAAIEIYIETKENGRSKKISYKGDAEGVKHLEKVIKNL